MQGVIRAIAIAYLVLITALLLSANPAQLVRWQGWLASLAKTLMPWAHLLSFSTLAVLTLSARWPAPRWSVVLLLVVYAGLTELAQFLVPRRTGEWKDWFMDLAGVAVGVAVCWSATSALGALRARKRPATPGNEWEVLQKAMSRPAAGEQSWWA